MCSFKNPGGLWSDSVSLYANEVGAANGFLGGLRIGCQGTNHMIRGWETSYNQSPTPRLTLSSIANNWVNHDI